ncbi:MAG: efflux RND transporter periplasmic adaptor subunit [Pseudomonadota bacterium]
MKPHALLSALLLIAADLQAAEFPAVLDWSGQVALAMPVTGVVETVAAKPGQRLKRGELMAGLNQTVYKAGVAEARAELDRLGEEEAEAKRDLERVQELYARTVSATTELDAARLRHARAASGLAMAQARLEKARRQLAESELRAPFDAVVLARMAEPGLVAATPCQPNPLFNVARDDEILARATLDAEQAARVRLGGKAVVEAAGGSRTGEVRGLGHLGQGKYALEVAIGRDGRLLAGQPATIRLP